MKPIYLAGLIVLAMILGFAILGMALVGLHRLHKRNAVRYTQLCTLLIFGAAYAMNQWDWPGVGLRSVDFWALMVILCIVSYSLVWAPIAYRLNRVAHTEFGESFMVSMLYSDSQTPSPDGFAQTKVIDRNAR